MSSQNFSSRAERNKKEIDKLMVKAEKDAQKLYLANREKEVETLNKDLKEKIKLLQNILIDSLHKDNTIDFSSLIINEKFPEFELPENLKKEHTKISKEEYLSKVSKPNFLEKLIPGWEERFQNRLQKADDNYKEYELKFELFINERNEKINALKFDYEKEKKPFEEKINKNNQEIEKLTEGYKKGLSTAVEKYCSLLLKRSEYPDDFPLWFRVAYVLEPKELVVEYDLPDKNIIPSVAEYKFIKTKDVINEKPRKLSEVKDLYQDVVSAICLRTIHELFKADQGNHLDVIVFNGFVNDIDPATGKDVRPCLISIRAIKDSFQQINLEKVDKKACLRNLGAQVSPRPDELMAVKPIIEFDMVDKRFVEGRDVLSNLEGRPNLMELDPFEFENLVNNLFEKVGFDTKTTRASRDGGIDVVAFDPRPIIGGKVVIQAKRYKNLVGVSAVRDLYGTMINEGANKGILVTTSHYGKDAYEFAKDKPVELIDGGGLLYLLEQNGIMARIIMPED